MNKKPVCLHFHIFKNAGSTVDGALARGFGRAFCAFDGPAPGSRIGPEAILVHLRGHPSAKVLSSHQFRFPLPESARNTFHPVFFVRHPIDRALSVYSFEKRQGGITPGSRMAEKYPIAEYIRRRLDQGVTTVVADFQTSLLSFGAGELPARAVTAADRERAFGHLESAFVVGVVERLDESLVCAEEAFGNLFGPVDLACPPRNVSHDRAETLVRRLEAGRHQLGLVLENELNSRNKNDFTLHIRAGEELDRRIASLSGFEGKLAAFRERCARIGRR
jgi:hypothetical protein